jgi:hypothetical protein
MKINLICNLNEEQWILGKFATKLRDHLIAKGYNTQIKSSVDTGADINHYLFYLDYKYTPNILATLMITHIDDSLKMNFLKQNSKLFNMGICMSYETMTNLISNNIESKKLCYVNPAIDGDIKIRPKLVGITCRVQADGRKRQNFLSRLAKDISPDHFKFVIMGDGWDKQIKDLEDNKFIVEYYNSFDIVKYKEIISSLDYYLYFGQDEGQIGFIDASSAGIETIVTKQGYHLDTTFKSNYLYDTYSELLDIFNKLQNNRNKIIDSVKTWNWNDYTNKHLEIWHFILNNKKNINSKYLDGINSNLFHIKLKKNYRKKIQLFLNTVKHFIEYKISKF